MSHPGSDHRPSQSENPSGRFSVVIPTLQRSDDLDAIVKQCAAHPLVFEVLVINNSPRPLVWESAKVRVLQQERNIYVNPAWNLGAREARGEFLAIVNDDVRFNDLAFDLAARGLRWFGVVGPDRSCFSLGRLEHPRLRLARRSTTLFGFGTFMCMRRDNYHPIPEEMRIWGGDDWLILQQRKPPGALVGVPFATEMGTTTQSPEAQQLRTEEQAVADRILPDLEGTRWWHRWLRGVEILREARHRLAGLTRR
ncbi:glycosyltransferase family 2 protein [Micrococcus luteus KDCGSN]|uniref:glycosyltransferase family 2 protein n=1 Tax=Micrococcus TaxID=1269 RepID=UPI00106C8EDB|nr:glycosyltransferase [Micrococcus aloeverae]TFE79572.1 glycosyltransferase [Micrococcus aloeverae]